MNFYKRHLGDIAKACAHLSQGQMGAYDLLLDWIYSNERPLPLDVAAVHRIGRAHSKAERANVDSVLVGFFTLTEAGYTQKRATEEIVKANAQAETNRAIAEAREASRRERKKHESLHEPYTNGQPSQTPDSRQELVENEPSIHTPPLAAVGVFEGHTEPGLVTPNPTAAFAILLNKAGHRCTSLNPELVGYVAEGGTLEHLRQVLALGGFGGKPAGYVLKAARRELVEKVVPIEGVTPRKAEPVRNPEGPSPVKPVTAESKRQERVDYAANMVRFGTWTQSQADSYLSNLTGEAQAHEA